MPSEPWLSGSRARMPRPALVRGEGEAMHLGAPELHHALAVGLLLEAHLHHVDGALEAEHLAGQRDGAAPLPGAGLAGDALRAADLVVVGLGHGGVGLVRAGRRDPLVLVVDVGRGAERLLEPVGAEERAGAPDLVDLADLVGDLHPAFRAHLLLDEPHGEEGEQVGGGDGLLRAGVEHRRHRPGQVGDDVVPVGGDLVLGQEVLGLHRCGAPSGRKGGDRNPIGRAESSDGRARSRRRCGRRPSGPRPGSTPWGSRPGRWGRPSRR